MSNLPSWIQEHLERYLRTDGEDGHMWDSSAMGGPGVVPTLLLTTTGRKSGKAQQIPVIYGEWRGQHIVVGSKGGAKSHPAWYLNLRANPSVKVQIKADKFNATAKELSGDEREAAWNYMTGLFSNYADYQKKCERQIPIVLLEREA